MIAGMIRYSSLLKLCGALWLVTSGTGCATRHFQRPRGRPDTVMRMEVTGYCPCGICCGWKRSWFGLGPPVVASGPQKGQRKIVGQTAWGTRARPGTVAADTSVLPFGTIVYVEGYGWGRVEDRGGAIKGNKLDLFYRSHRQALEWGRQQKQVQVWYPR
jgi:3D (Asp-Asp-Asp) domain-containing protein